MHGSDFINKVFDTNCINESNITQFLDRAILCPKNDDCDNYIVQNRVRDEEKIYYSCDSIQCEDNSEEKFYPTEFLNSLNHSGLPSHKYMFKTNTCVMLISNLNPKEGLINGARMIISQLRQFTLSAKLFNSG